MNKSISVAVLSHIASLSAVLFPVAKIARALSDLGVVVVVDGAHAPLHAPDLDLEFLGRCGVSFYVGNLHKWGFAPRPCAFLWARADKRESLMPLVTSNVYKQGFREDFYMQVRN